MPQKQIIQLYPSNQVLFWGLGFFSHIPVLTGGGAEKLRRMRINLSIMWTGILSQIIFF